MRKWITLLMTCLVVGSYANANNGQVNLEAGYRHDDISWKSRVPSHNPVVSESHKFEDLDIFQLGIDARTTVGCNFYVRANAYWGWILDGDYKNDLRTNFDDSYDSGFRFGFEGNRHNVIDDKYVYGIGAAIGYPFYFCDCTTVLAPVIGYAFDEQSVQFDGRRLAFQDSCASDNTCGDCCRQTFNSRWYGPFVGVDFNYRPYCSCWNLYADLEFHWGDFKGRTNHDSYNENGVGDFRSTNVRGWVFGAGAEYDLCNCWTVGVSVKFQDWRAHKNHHVDNNFAGNYGSDSSEDVRASSHVKWHSYAINLTLGKEF